ncbi:MAG: glycosyltransferase [Bacteroidetes bacterium]|nr:glycosyltransferase [Bacteroidota bacterium]
MIKLGADLPIHIAPVGIDTNDYPINKEPNPTLVFHIGAMDWLPNIEGIEWFFEKVWPIVKAKFPAAQLALAGKKMPESIKAYQSNSIEVNDFVTDNIAFIGNGGIMIVPLFSGSGMRVKIVEGMAMQKAIVTTSIGAEGIAGVDGRDFLIGNTAEEFASNILKLLEDPSTKINGNSCKKIRSGSFRQFVYRKKTNQFFRFD